MSSATDYLEPDVTAGAPAGGRRLRVAHLSAATLLVLLAIWWAVTASGMIAPLFLPPPAAVFERFIAVLTEGYVDSTLLEHLGASLARVFAALFFSAAIAIPVGFAIALSPVGRGILDPLLELLRPIPPLAYLPLVIIWFGIGEVSKVLVIGVAMLAPIALSTAAGVRSVAPDRLDAARSLGATRAQLLRYVIFPSALPEIVTGIRIALGAGWTTLVAAELVAATRGLGFMIQSAAQFLVTDVVIMGILVIAAVAFLLEAVVRVLEKIFVPWRGRL
ncbi:taurine transport system permease protein [Pseudochelatococcus lubricantis]|uniref:Taurine transport system permease protein n=1 Tax=Pseudochelatococcus lubricantis TaxID=1538102 RepID=A0ABX0V1G9_9HYPH|nr:ABC transporter permease subunit [Pseudochelatococcus lubricantis]NIJ58973.1 taurine transport system permease protein [Pseudochelatococcus lubricantis]